MSIPSIGNPDYIKYTNINRVFQLILQNQPISRTDIADMVDISKVTVTNCVDYLLQKKIICETGSTAARRGRPRIQLVCNKDYGILIAFAADLIESRMLVTDFAGNILEAKSLELPLPSPEDTIKAIVSEIHHIQTLYPNLPILGTGFSISGFYDYNTETVVSANYGKAWIGFNIRETFNRYEPNIPIFVERLANSGALGEASFGVRTDARVHAYLHCAFGIGAGIYRKTSTASDLFCVSSRFGHTTINYQGRKCHCGNRGCLEAYASLSSLLEQIDPNMPLTYSNLKKVQEDYFAGKQEIVEQVHSVFRYLAVGITNLYNAYQPDIIYLGGLINLFLSDHSMNMILDEVFRQIPESFRVNLEIIPSTLKENALCYGGISTVRNHMIELTM